MLAESDLFVIKISIFHAFFIGLFLSIMHVKIIFGPDSHCEFANMSKIFDVFDYAF